MIAQIDNLVLTSEDHYSWVWTLDLTYIFSVKRLYEVIQNKQLNDLACVDHFWWSFNPLTVMHLKDIILGKIISSGSIGVARAFHGVHFVLL